MNIDTQTQQASALVKALQSNGLFSAVSGLLVIIGSPYISEWFAGINHYLVIAIGIGLMIFATRLGYLAKTERLALLEVKLIIASDIAWVVISLLLMWWFMAELTNLAIVITTLVSIVVATFAYFQYRGLNRYLTN